MKTLFDSAIQRFPTDLPETYRVTVTYRDQDRRREFREEMDLDFGIYWNRLRVDRNGLHEIHRELERIGKEIHKWSASLGGGIQVATDRDVERRTARIEEQWVEAEDANVGDQGNGKDGSKAPEDD